MEENKMSSDFFTFVDEEGNEIEFELIGQCELKGNTYFAMIPSGSDDSGEFCEYNILKLAMEDGEEVYVTIDDDDEFDMVADYFDDLFSEEIDYDATEDDTTK